MTNSSSESHSLQDERGSDSVSEHLNAVDLGNHGQAAQRPYQGSCFQEESLNEVHKARIGRRKEVEGKVKWISQSRWEDEQRSLKEQEGRGTFAFLLDDSQRSSKIIISSPALIAVVQRMIPPAQLESCSDGVAIEEPFSQLLHSINDMRSDMISCHADVKDLEDFTALELFLYERQPQYKSARNALNTRLGAMTSLKKSERSSSPIWKRSLVGLVDKGISAPSCRCADGV
ncbi:hypothetical protein EV356DRAFT_499723 [Viridothelium virens]|uniref:Uncharacterized protein n=1 Tax=Viridothelium virens TaxID=1048519 RepID=A0A6A6HNH8_VIRVR|nr:hypothetical protein EV356DRAFT_499723 [Viridothelium virens]